jgi:hypothetical protein
MSMPRGTLGAAAFDRDRRCPGGMRTCLSPEGL